MADTNQTIQTQIDNFDANYAHSAMGLLTLGTIIAALLRPTTDTDARTVTDHVLVMSTPGWVRHVVATAGGATGITLLGPAGATTATKQATIAYDVNGIATITFHAADAVTAAKVTYSPWPYPTNGDRTVGLGNLLAMVPT